MAGSWTSVGGSAAAGLGLRRLRVGAGRVLAGRFRLGHRGLGRRVGRGRLGLGGGGASPGDRGPNRPGRFQREAAGSACGSSVFGSPSGVAAPGARSGSPDESAGDALPGRPKIDSIVAPLGADSAVGCDGTWPNAVPQFEQNRAALPYSSPHVGQLPPMPGWKMTVSVRGAVSAASSACASASSPAIRWTLASMTGACATTSPPPLRWTS